MIMSFKDAVQKSRIIVADRLLEYTFFVSETDNFVTTISRATIRKLLAWHWMFFTQLPLRATPTHSTLRHVLDGNSQSKVIFETLHE